MTNQDIQQPNSSNQRFNYGYIIASIACICGFLNAGMIFSFGVFFKPLLTEFGWTRAVTSGAFSMSLFLLGLLYIGTGRLNDRCGLRILVMVCGTVFGLGYLLMSQVGALWQQRWPYYGGAHF